MSDPLCDAKTGSGNPCKNRSVGEANGRHYCRVASHRVQVEAVAGPVDAVPDATEVEAVVEETEAPEAAVIEGGEAEAAVDNSGPDDVDADDDGPEAVEEVVDEAVEEAPSEPEPAPAPEPVPETYTHTCPSCGSSRGLIVAILGNTPQAGCRDCGHRWAP